MYTLLQLVFIISPTLLHMAFIISIAHCIQLSFIIPAILNYIANFIATRLCPIAHSISTILNYIAHSITAGLYHIAHSITDILYYIAQFITAGINPIAHGCDSSAGGSCLWLGGPSSGGPLWAIWESCGGQWFVLLPRKKHRRGAGRSRIRGVEPVPDQTLLTPGNLRRISHGG